MTYREDRTSDEYTVERERVVEQPVERPVYQPPPGQANVNVAGGGGGYAAPVAYAPGPLYYARRVVALLFGILQVLLIVRIVLLALGANQDNGLVNFIMAATDPFVAPFVGIFNFDRVTPNGQNILDVAALVSLVGYFLLELLILAILSIADRDRVRV